MKHISRMTNANLIKQTVFQFLISNLAILKIMLNTVENNEYVLIKMAHFHMHHLFWDTPYSWYYYSSILACSLRFLTKNDWRHRVPCIETNLADVSTVRCVLRLLERIWLCSFPLERNHISSTGKESIVDLLSSTTVLRVTKHIVADIQNDEFSELFYNQGSPFKINDKVYFYTVRLADKWIIWGWSKLRRYYLRSNASLLIRLRSSFSSCTNTHSLCLP